MKDQISVFIKLSISKIQNVKKENYKILVHMIQKLKIEKTKNKQSGNYKRSCHGIHRDLQSSKVRKESERMSVKPSIASLSLKRSRPWFSPLRFCRFHSCSNQGIVNNFQTIRK